MKDGQAVTHLDTGDYTITVSDLSAEHDFHLVGKGVNEATSVEGTGTETWNVTFTDDQYLFFCDVHAATMQGSFTVGSVQSTTTTATTPATPIVAHEKATVVHHTVTIRGTANQVMEASYTFAATDTYIRTVIRTPNMVMYINPVVRYDGARLPAPLASVDRTSTWLHRGVIFIIAAAVLFFLWRR